MAEEEKEAVVVEDSEPQAVDSIQAGKGCHMRCTFGMVLGPWMMFSRSI